MRLKFLAAAVLALSTAGPGLADILVEDAHVWAAMPAASSAAVYMVLRNDGAEDDRLLAASAGIAAKTMLHGSSESDGGVMTMTGHEGGVVIPSGGSHALARGGDHVMLMGLSEPLEQGATLDLLLTFERAGEIRVEVPVDLSR
ncbi:copper chaperone PCu(A)C [Alloyangia pacifica]|uniref:copper chaperone PCu(A)C n=1 Tax=Alloyangia pacifica TaxID=311180 RepID=UPI001CFE63CB|nr:copper chaperone PCu(A)C [Alloyangia pacifica]